MATTPVLSPLDLRRRDGVSQPSSQRTGHSAGVAEDAHVDREVAAYLALVDLHLDDGGAFRDGPVVVKGREVSQPRTQRQHDVGLPACLLGLGGTGAAYGPDVEGVVVGYSVVVAVGGDDCRAESLSQPDCLAFGTTPVHASAGYDNRALSLCEKVGGGGYPSGVSFGPLRGAVGRRGYEINVHLTGVEQVARQVHVDWAHLARGGYSEGVS